MPVKLLTININITLINRWRNSIAFNSSNLRYYAIKCSKDAINVNANYMGSAFLRTNYLNNKCKGLFCNFLVAHDDISRAVIFLSRFAFCIICLTEIKNRYLVCLYRYGSVRHRESKRSRLELVWHEELRSRRWSTKTRHYNRYEQRGIKQRRLWSNEKEQTRNLLVGFTFSAY